MIQAQGDYVLVEVQKKDTGGLVLPGDKESSQEGIVVNVGQGILDLQSGKRTEMFVKEGDIIIWEKFADADYSFEEGGDTYTLIKIQQVMAIGGVNAKRK